MKLEGRKIYKGIAEAEAIVTKDGISFYGGVDPDTGVVVEVGHDLEEIDTIIAVGCIISEIPCVDKIDINCIKTGQKIIVNGSKGTVEVK